MNNKLIFPVAHNINPVSKNDCVEIADSAESAEEEEQATPAGATFTVSTTSTTTTTVTPEDNGWKVHNNAHARTGGIE